MVCRDPVFQVELTCVAGDKSGMQGCEVTGSRDLVTRGFINPLKHFGFFPEGNEKPRRALNTEVHNLISVLKHHQAAVLGQAQSSSASRQQGDVGIARVTDDAGARTKKAASSSGI